MIGVKLITTETTNKFVVFYCLRVKSTSQQRTRGFCIFSSLSGEAEVKQWVQVIRAKIHNIPINRKFVYHLSVLTNAPPFARTFILFVLNAHVRFLWSGKFRIFQNFLLVER